MPRDYYEFNKKQKMSAINRGKKVSDEERERHKAEVEASNKAWREAQKKKDESPHTVFPMRTCPVCGAKFIPAPAHVFKLQGNVGDFRKGYLICSYRCAMILERSPIINKMTEQELQPADEIPQSEETENKGETANE